MNILFLDVNLYHEFVTGCAMTRVLHLVNQTLTEWYGKKQATVATATYSSELVATCTMTDMIIDLHYTLGMMGVLNISPTHSEIST